MTIEISRGDNARQYRINPWNGRTIDSRVNRSGARWETHKVYATSQEATNALLKLERKPKDKPRE